MSGVQAQDAPWPLREKCGAAPQPFPGSVRVAQLFVWSGFTNLLKQQTVACRETALKSSHAIAYSSHAKLLIKIWEYSCFPASYRVN